MQGHGLVGPCPAARHANERGFAALEQPRGVKIGQQLSGGLVKRGVLHVVRPWRQLVAVVVAVDRQLVHDPRALGDHVAGGRHVPDLFDDPVMVVERDIADIGLLPMPHGG